MTKANDSLIAFLPCRKGSQRIKEKNIKPILDFKMGLVEIKLSQLLKVEKIKKIFLSTDDIQIINFARRLENKKIIIDIRPEHLCSNDTSTDLLINYVAEKFEEKNILWTHVTSPFINSELYQLFIEKYFEVIHYNNDSLMTVTKIQKFLWDDKGPLSYTLDKEKWPRTQTLKPLYEINSGAFIAHSNIYKNFKNRIGISPFLYEIDQLTAFDIDWPEDWIIAETLMSNNIKKVI